MSTPIKSLENFQNLLQEATKHFSIQDIAINLLVVPTQIEDWIAGNNLPTKSTLPVLNNVLKRMVSKTKKV